MLSEASSRSAPLPNPSHPRFDGGADRELASDSIAWLSDLFEQSVRQFAALGLANGDVVGDQLALLAKGLDGISKVDVSRRITTVESAITAIGRTGKLYGRHYDDLLALKYLHQRYSNYLRWLDTAGR